MRTIDYNITLPHYPFIFNFQLIKMLQKTDGIVLNHTRYGESSAIFHIFTRELGMRSYMVNGVFGKKKKDKILLLQPLNILELEAYHKENKDIQHIKEVRLKRNMQRLPFSQERRAQAFLITEILSRILRNEGVNNALFNFIEDAIIKLDSDNEGLENIHLLFLFQLTRFLGFFPNNNYSASKPFFDFYEGNFVADEPQHPFFLPPDESMLFARFFSCENENITQLAKNVHERRILLKSVITLYEKHFPELGKIRSVEVLSSLF